MEERGKGEGLKGSETDDIDRVHGASLYGSVFRGFCGSTFLAWGKYATLLHP
jgi:hypothetical protein